MLVAFASTASAQDATPPVRPRITGISHAAFYVNDMTKARAFYEGFLGFASPFSIPMGPAGDLVWIKINDRQTVELFPAAKGDSVSERLYHIALQVDDADAMRLYLRSRGIAVPPTTPTGRIGNRNFFVKDPSGNTVEIVQYLPDGWTVREAGHALPDSRISTHMTHVGIMIAQLDSAARFYGDILGFHEFWRGSANGTTLSWVNMRVPDGDDYVEFMLYEKYPPIAAAHTLQHVCLEVANVDVAKDILDHRVLPVGSPAPSLPRVGRNGKRQLNYFDPDGTRVELMEPSTVDGLPRPPSDAPAPVGQRKGGQAP